jgi:hypothetical protein
VLIAHIHCSDPVCTAEIEVTVENLEELDGFVCECGYGYVLIAVEEPRPSHILSI